MAEKIKKVCVLLDDETVVKCFGLSLEKAAVENDLEVSLVIVREPNSYDLKLGWRKEIIKAIIFWIRKILHTEPPLAKKAPLKDFKVFDKAEIVYAPAIKHGKMGTALDSATINLIKERKIDLILRRGFGIVKGEILTCVPHGVLGSHYGRLNEYRGTLSAVAAHMDNEPNIYLSYQILNEGLDKGDLVLEVPVDITNSKSYKQTSILLTKAAVNGLSEAIKRLNLPDFQPVKYQPGGKNYNLTSWQQFPSLFFRYILTEVKRRIRYYLRLLKSNGK